jgi:hypothetical protein
MSDLSYLIWLIATALMTVTVLTVCTLASAGILGRRHRQPAEVERLDDPPNDADRARGAQPERRRAA